MTDGETQAETMQGSDKFRVQTFYVIIDKLVTEPKKRSKAYEDLITLFGFLTKLLNICSDEIKTQPENLVKLYHGDLQMNIISELEQFVPLLKLQNKKLFLNENEILAPLKVLNWIVDNDFIDVFPNVYIAYRLFVTIPIANCEAERSFSVLKRIKNMFRSTMLHDRLSSLSILNIENDLLRSIDFSGIIKYFATEKSRKKVF